MKKILYCEHENQSLKKTPLLELPTINKDKFPDRNNKNSNKEKTNKGGK